MTDPDGTLARIDADLEAWESGPDAYRWEPDAEAGVRYVEATLMLDEASVQAFRDAMADCIQRIRAEFERLSGAFADAWRNLDDMVLWPPPDPTLTDETRRMIADAPTDAALALLVPTSCGDEHAVVLNSTWNPREAQ